MAKFKSNAETWKRLLLDTGKFTDAMVSKDRGYIRIILVKEGRLLYFYVFSTFNRFEDEDSVLSAIREEVGEL